MLTLQLTHWIAATARHPVLDALALIGGTFILEDAATVIGAAQAQAGDVPVWVALLALYVGIVVGDLGLYGLGALAARLRWARRLIPEEATTHGRAWLSGRLSRVVFISRFLPGARLPAYTACGFLGASFGRFAATSVVATLVWTTLLFSISMHVGAVLEETLGIWRWAGMAGFALTVVLLGRAAAAARQGAR